VNSGQWSADRVAKHVGEMDGSRVENASRLRTGSVAMVNSAQTAGSRGITNEIAVNAAI
jgi:hypothetical protein